MRNRLILLAGLIAAAALLVAACGGDGDESGPDNATPPDTEQPATEPDGSETPSEPADDETAAETPTEPEEEAADEPVDEPTEEPTEEPEDQVQPGPADDPDREVLELGETFAASISEVGGVRQFRFEADEGALIRIFVDGKAGMDPLVTLLEPNRTEIASEDDVSPGANRDAVLIARLPSSGLQVVRVEAFGNSIGDFEITITQLPEDPDADSVILTIGTTVTGTIWEPGDIDIFEFEATAGQPVRIYADGAIGVDLQAQIFAPDGTFIAKEDDSGHGLDPELSLTLPEDGMYRVEVFPFGNKIGPYEFSVQTIAESTEPADPATLEEVQNTALAYLAALQGGDALNMYALAGPEAIAFRGWESAADVEFDLTNVAETVAGGEPGTPTASVDGDRGRVTVPIGETGQAMRFDMIQVGGRWFVDLWALVAS